MRGKLPPTPDRIHYGPKRCTCQPDPTWSFRYGQGIVTHYCTCTSYHMALSWMERFGHEVWWRGDSGIINHRVRRKGRV